MSLYMGLLDQDASHPTQAAIVVTALTGAGIDFGFTSGTWTAATGTTLGTGDIYVFITYEGSAPVLTSVTVGGVTQTTALAVNSLSANNKHAVYVCSGVATATGNVSLVFTGAANAISASWILVQNGGTATGAATNIASFPTTTSNSVTVSGRVSLVCYTVAAGNSNFTPVTWTGCALNNSLQDFTWTGTGNGGQSHINYATATGTVTAAGNANWNGQTGTYFEVDIP